MSSELIKITLLGETLHIRCDAEERADLMEAASLLDKNMRQIREKQKIVGLERIALMTALQLTMEHMKLQKNNAEYQTSVETHICRLQNTLNEVLS